MQTAQFFSKHSHASNCATDKLKSDRIAKMVEAYAGQSRDRHYLAYFDLFNRGLFYEAHDVLENLWLPRRKEPDGDFYKGLIQLAGAFVHLQKNRLKPAAALFKLAETNLAKYGQLHEGLALRMVHELVESYSTLLLESDYQTNPLETLGPPRLAPEIDET
jgi:predicted metal-dependent hydrolase